MYHGLWLACCPPPPPPPAILKHVTAPLGPYGPSLRVQVLWAAGGGNAVSYHVVRGARPLPEAVMALGARGRGELERLRESTCVVINFISKLDGLAGKYLTATVAGRRGLWLHPARGGGMGSE